MSNFLQNIIIPFYQAQAIKQNNFILYDLNQKVLLASSSVIQHLQFDSQNDMKDKTFADFAHIKPEMITQLINIFVKVIKSKKKISFIGIGGSISPKFKNYHELIFQSFEPILDDKQNVVAVLAQKLPTVDQNLIYLFFPEFKINFLENSQLIEQLTSREFEILYLLCNGFSQYETAAKLKISRSTVLKTISDRIISKLSILNNDSLEIIKIGISLGMQAKIPRSLVKEQIVIIPSL